MKSNHKRVRGWLLAASACIVAAAETAAMAADAYRGQLMGVGMSQIIVQTNAAGVKTFDVPPGARITRNGRRVKLEQLHAMDTVTVMAERSSATVIDARASTGVAAR